MAVFISQLRFGGNELLWGMEECLQQESCVSIALKSCRCLLTFTACDKRWENIPSP